MKKIILVAGGTGDLGNRIIKALLKRSADVIAIVRPGSAKEKVEQLEKSGVRVIKVDMANHHKLTQALKDVSCVVSALAGLEDTIVGAQSNHCVLRKQPKFPR